MSHVVPISDKTYRSIEEIARQEGTTPEALTEALLAKVLADREAEREAIQRQNAEWSARLDEQIARADRGENPVYESMEEFFEALDRIPHADEDSEN